MNNTRAIILVAIAALLGVGIYYFTRSPGLAPAPDSTPAQKGMSGMGDMSGMDAVSGMVGMDGAADPDCIRYDLIEGVWVCTATASGSGN